MTLFRATVVDTPGDPFGQDDALVADIDGAVLVREGIIVARGSYSVVHADYPHEPVVELAGGMLLPGFIDTHVHYPQLRAIGGLGMPLLDWLEHCALPEESKLAERAYAQAVADEFLAGLLQAGTTSALVFGAHFAGAMEEFFTAAAASGLNITSGLVLSDRLLPPVLLTSPERAFTDSVALIERWHGHGRLRYAVTPRFAYSTSSALLEVCSALLGDGMSFTSHINENLVEIAKVAELFPGSRDYLDIYHRHGLIGERSVLAHNVHVSDPELELMADTGCFAAHCPTSNCALGSGLFPMRRHVQYGVGVALGSDIGAGTGLFLPKEGLQAYFVQQLQGVRGLALTPAHLLYLATRAGALALGVGDRVGDFTPGKEFDAVWLRPTSASTLAVNLEHASDAGDALARIFALATPADVAGVWVGGRQLCTPTDERGRADAGRLDAVWS